MKCHEMLLQNANYFTQYIQNNNNNRQYAAYTALCPECTDFKQVNKQKAGVKVTQHYY